MRAVLCAYCARENPKKIQSSKKIQKNSKKVAKIPNHPLTPNPTQGGRRGRGDGRKRMRVLRVDTVSSRERRNDGWNDGWNDGMME